MWYWSADILFWQVSIDHSLDVQYQRSTRQTKAVCLFWTMAAMLGNSVVVVRTRPRAIPLAMITMRKSTHGFPLLSHDAYGAPLGGPSGRRSSATSYLLLGLCHASVNWLSIVLMQIPPPQKKKMNCIMGSVKKANWINIIHYLAVNKTRVFFKLTIDFLRRTWCTIPPAML